MENFRWLAAVVADHPDRLLVGRTRLQKTVRLLQRRGLPTTYKFSNYFYGPYSEALQADVKLSEALGLISEESSENKEGTAYFRFHARDKAAVKEIEPFSKAIQILSKTDPVILELAATYDAFREQGSGHKEALNQLRRKKGAKCDEGREGAALKLLESIGLPSQ